MEQQPQIIHESWHQYLQPLFDDPKMIKIKTDILPNCYFHPEKHQIFRVFSMPITDIKVVILGQDPYPNGEGIGLAFAVNLASNLPASLRIIKAEVDLRTELHYYKVHQDACWKNLEHWTQQGVFLLNTALTVEHKNAGSHLGYWYWFTREVVKIISKVQPCIWMLWGAKAKGFKDFIDSNITPTNEANINELGQRFEGMNISLLADHPAAETYPNSTYKFTGCNHFNLANEILKAKNLEQIKW